MFEEIIAENSTKSIDELLSTIQATLSNPTLISNFNSPADRSLVKARVFVQDNGASMQLYPFESKTVNSTTGEEKTFSFLLMDTPPVGWELIEEPVERFLEKQVHCCFLLPDNELSLDLLSLEESVVKSRINAKLPGINPATVCAVKTYGSTPMFPLNAIVEVVGILEKRSVDDDETDIYNLLPTLHCISYEFKSVVDFIPSVPAGNLPDLISQPRMELLKNLKTLVYGDLLVAEYLCAQLFFQVTKRVAGTPTGTFSLNVFGQTVDFEPLYGFLQSLWPYTKSMDFDLESLNEKLRMQSFQSEENQEEGLYLGELQAPDHTYFIIKDKITEGALNERGYNNLKALQHAIDFGTVDYEIPFGTFNTDCNFTFAIFGTSSSLAKASFKIPIHPTEPELKDISLPPNFASFITHMKSQPFDISPEMEKVIHADFLKTQAQLREQGEPADDGTFLLQRIVLAECLAKSYGYFEMTMDAWEKSGKMETERLSRMK